MEPLSGLRVLEIGDRGEAAGKLLADADHTLPPIRPDGEHALWIAGEYAVAGVLAALLQCERTGRGQLLDVSMHEAVSATTEGAFPNWEYLRQISQRWTGRHASPSPS